MRRFLQHRVIVGLTVLVLGAPQARAQGIFVTDFHSTTASFYDLTATGHLRRGTTSNVQIVKDLIDLVPFDQIKTSTSGVTLSGKTNGRTSAGKGFIAFSLAVSATQTLGSTVTVDVGLLDHFKFTVRREGLISNVTFTPDPATVSAGTAITINGTGSDFGTPALTAIQCHTVTTGASTATTFSATATRSVTCANSGPYGFSVNGTGANDAPIYATSNHLIGFSLASYKALPPPLPPCQSAPGIGTPTVTSPTNGQRFEFVSGTASPQSLTVRWSNITSSNQAAPNNEFIVVLTRTDATSTLKNERTLIPAVTTKDSSLVVGTVLTKNFVLPGSYQLSIRARNCGDFGPITATTFQLTFRP
jgi:hypothetical protein